MKKFLIITLILSIIVNSFVFAEPNATPTPTATATSTASATATQKPTPSVIAPMAFTVTTANGDEIVLDDATGNSAEIIFTIKGRNGVFNEAFSINKIVNESTNYVYSFDNKKFDKNSPDWTFKETVAFTKADAGNTVTFTLHWTDFAGNPREERARLTIGLARPEITIKTVVDQLAVVPGSSAQITYELKNTGNVPLKNVLLHDDTVSYLTGGQPFTSDDFLGKGETLTKTASIIVDGEVKLNPLVKFTYNGKEYENTGEAVTIHAEEVVPTIMLTCNTYSVAQKGNQHNFNYTIANTSHVPITNLRIYDSDAENAVLVNGPMDLEAGQAYSGTFLYSVQKSGFHKFKVVYSYKGSDGDKELSIKTDKTLKLPNEVFAEIVAITPGTVYEPGKVTLTLQIENGTPSELRNIVINEENNLFSPIEIKNSIIPAMDGEEPGVFTHDLDVYIPATNTVVLFNISYTMNEEVSTINTQYPIVFSDSKPTDPVSITPTPLTNNSNGNNSTVWLILLGILLLLLIAALIVLLIIYFKHKNGPDNPTVHRKVTPVFDDKDDDENFEYTDEEYEELMREQEGMNDIPPVVPVEEIETVDEADDFDDFGEVDDEGVKIYKRK